MKKADLFLVAWSVPLGKSPLHSSQVNQQMQVIWSGKWNFKKSKSQDKIWWLPVTRTTASKWRCTYRLGLHYVPICIPLYSSVFLHKSLQRMSIVCHTFFVVAAAKNVAWNSVFGICQIWELCFLSVRMSVFASPIVRQCLSGTRVLE